jgi:predicted PurR-regulated permease PerM
METHEPIRAQRVAWAVVALTLTGFGLWTLREFLPALIWASILTIAFWPLFQRARRTWPPGHHNILLPTVFTLGIALVFVLPVVIAGVQVGREARSVIAWVESARQGGLPVPDLVAHLPLAGEAAAAWWRDNLSDPEAATELLKRLKNPEFVLAGREFGAALLHRAIVFGFCLMTMFFLFKDGDSLAAQMQRASVRALGPVGERIGRQIIASVHGTVDGLVLVGLAEGALLYVVYLFTSVPHPSLFGAATAVGAMIPLGAPVAFFLAAALAAAGGGMGKAAVIVVLGMVISFVADHFVRPALIGGATKLPFVWVLFGILGGVTTWGLLGLFIGPAIMAVLILLWREWTEPA